MYTSGNFPVQSKSFSARWGGYLKSKTGEQDKNYRGFIFWKHIWCYVKCKYIWRWKLICGRYVSGKYCNVTEYLFRGLIHVNRFTVTQLSFHFEWFIHYVSVGEREEKSDTFGYFTDISNDSYNLVCTSIVKTWRHMLLYKMVVCSVWVPMCIETDACVSGADVTEWRKSRWFRQKNSSVTWDF